LKDDSSLGIDIYSSYIRQIDDVLCFLVSRTCEQYDKSTLPPMEPAGLVGGVEILRFYGDDYRGILDRTTKRMECNKGS